MKNGDGVRNIEARCLLYSELFDHVLDSFAKSFVHAFLISNLGDLAKEETRNSRKVECEFVWHT